MARRRGGAVARWRGGVVKTSDSQSRDGMVFIYALFFIYWYFYWYCMVFICFILLFIYCFDVYILSS